MGAGVAKAGTWALIASGILKTVAFIFISPLLGMLLGAVLMLAHFLAVRALDAEPRRPLFRRLQLVSASLYSLGHGGNDAQKTIGIIWMLLIGGRLPRRRRPGAGLGRDRLLPDDRARHHVRRLAHREDHGAAHHQAQARWAASAPRLSGAITLFLATALGIPVSTTHTITGAIVGVGATQSGASAVRWGVAGNILWAWILTIPCSAFIAGLAWWLGRHLFG